MSIHHCTVLLQLYYIVKKKKKNSILDESCTPEQQFDLICNCMLYLTKLLTSSDLEMNSTVRMCCLWNLDAKMRIHMCVWFRWKYFLKSPQEGFIDVWEWQLSSAVRHTPSTPILLVSESFSSHWPLLFVSLSFSLLLRLFVADDSFPVQCLSKGRLQWCHKRAREAQTHSHRDQKMSRLVVTPEYLPASVYKTRKHMIISVKTGVSPIC